uniref:Uncharacterized protein n=1 Tax=Crocodylus porosus TaxID=8502 RepID=A0A7M4EFI7_CROPO
FYQLQAGSAKRREASVSLHKPCHEAPHDVHVDLTLSTREPPQAGAAPWSLTRLPGMGEHPFLTLPNCLPLTTRMYKACLCRTENF